MSKFINFFILSAAILCLLTFNAAAQTSDAKAENILKKAVEKLGGEHYLQVKNIAASGNYATFRGTVADIPMTFTDVIEFPEKERTEFKQGGGKIIQVNAGETGWIYEASTNKLRDQKEKEIESFKRTMRTNLDNFLRGVWRKEGGQLTYVGRREASLAKRNDVVKLTYADGFWVEFEFDSTDALPMKSVFPAAEISDAKEEERYAQFIEIQGVLAPFVIDRYIDGKQQSRTNYINIEFNKIIPAAAFIKPANIKDLKKGLKFNR